MSRRRQQSENALFIFCLLKNIIQPLGAKDFDLNQGAKLEFVKSQKPTFYDAINFTCNKRGKHEPNRD